MEGSTVRNPPCRSDYRPGDELVAGSPWCVEDDAADEALAIAIEDEIARLPDLDLAEIVIGDTTQAVYDAACRVVGRVIRAALRRSDATLTDDERTLVAFVCETVEAEVRNG